MRNRFLGQFIALILMLIAVQVTAADPISSKNVRKPNFVIVLADDVSWSSFGCMNAGLQTRTPHIDRLATQGMRFDSFYCAASQCCPVRHELYTSLLPSNSGVYANGSKPKGTFKNVVNFLGDLGYDVGLTGKTHFSTKTKFKKIEGFTANCNHDKPVWNLGGVKKFITGARSAKKPFCVFICSVHAHHPWTIGDASRFPQKSLKLPPHMVDTPTTRECMSRHAAEVEDLDNQVGATMKMLADMKLDKDTVLIFLSEQGTAMPNGKWSIYNFGCRALCVVRWPDKVKAGTTTDARAMYCDIVPTLVDLAGGDAPKVDGRSLRPVLEDPTAKHRDHAFLYNVTPIFQRAIVGSQYKLIWTPDRSQDYAMKNRDNKGKLFAKAWSEWVEKAKIDPAAQAKVNHIDKHPEFELYDLKKDPWELKNLAQAPEHAERVKKMTAELRQEMRTYNDTWDPDNPPSKSKKGGRKKKGKRK